nr:putative disease resistance protein RGA3 [Quercus suber]
MAEGILFGLAQKIIENLASQLFQEIGSLWGVDDDLEKIKNSVSTIQAVLQDAAMQQSHNHQVGDWLGKLKDAVYDADDLLSEFSTEAMRRKMVSGNKIAKEVRTCFSLSNPLAFRCKMSHKIKAMKEKLDEIAEDRKKYHLKEDQVEVNVVGGKREPTHSFVRGEDVIGREEDKNAIIDLLLDSNVEEDVSVIPIVGMGGLGKSTLAQYVYNDEKVQNYFELKMWVWVYDVFELKIIIEKIIASATGDAPRNLEIDQLQIQLREKIIDRKKYLLVLDDVWNEDREKWLNLKSLLMGGSKGSKIIITTRIRLVAEITLPDLPFIDLKGLSKEQSWVLFRQRAFKKGQENNNPKLVTVGREIVEMCQGVPLAIKVIGNALYFKKKESEC